MKRFAILLSVLSMIVGILTAKPVLPADAARVAANFWRQVLDGKGELQLVTWQYGDIYLFVGEYGGFVMVSSDDCAHPVIAYSRENDIDPENLPVPLANRLEICNLWIAEGARQKVRATEKAASSWLALRNGIACKGDEKDRVGPLLETNWHQDGAYALLTPNNTPAGCAATAQSQLMRYWKYPAFGFGRDSYNCTPYGAQSADFAHTLYDWANMPSQVSTSSPYIQQMAVSTLMYHVGVSLHMAYAEGGSGAAGIAGVPGVPSIDNSLKDFFCYNKKMRAVFKTNGYTDQQWVDSLVAELNLLHPIVYCGVAPEGGHGFVCDGYEHRAGQVWFHFNFGWSGNGDGYYTTDDICPNVSPTGVVGHIYHFNQSNQALLGVVPDYRMHVSDTLLTFTRDGGESQVLFCSIDTSDMPWNVCANQSWVRVEHEGFEHVGEIRVVVDGNSAGEERQAVVTFSQGGEQVVVHVVQTYYSEEDYCPWTVVMESTQNGGWEGNAHLGFESPSGYVYNTASLLSGGYDSVEVGVPPADVNIVFHPGGGTDRFINYRVYNLYGEKLVDVEYAFMNAGAFFVEKPCEPKPDSPSHSDTTVVKTEIYDFTGRLLYSTSSAVSPSVIPSGVYLVRLFTNYGETTKKFFKF